MAFRARLRTFLSVTLVRQTLSSLTFVHLKDIYPRSGRCSAPKPYVEEYHDVLIQVVSLILRRVLA